MLFGATSLFCQTPNILLIITDDHGADVMNGYHDGNVMPETPTMDSLRAEGVTFLNAYSAPVCSPTRAAIMTGKYGIKTGVQGVPGNLGLEHSSIFHALASQTNNQYADAVIGKWHISQPANADHPMEHGADYYMGILSGGVPDYYAWNKTENGVTQIDSSYVTTSLTDAAIDWIAEQQTSPWFLWLAYNAPHTPYHVPPSHMHTSFANPQNNYRKFLSAIEAVDYSINRLLQSMSAEELANTLIIFVGDNGTPGNVIQDYASNHGKGSLYQGGVRVPMIVSGATVDRKGERESALVHVTDIYATILEVAGAELPGGIYNSLSFEHLLTNESSPNRDFNYTEVASADSSAYTIRSPQYKLIKKNNGSQELYDLLIDSLETNNLNVEPLATDLAAIKADLAAEAIMIRSSWSCRDHIQNGDEEGIDCGGSECAACVSATAGSLEDLGIMVFPNPTTDFLTVRSKTHELKGIKVYSSFGELLLAQQGHGAKQMTIDLTGLPPQFLLLRLELDDDTYVLKVARF